MIAEVKPVALDAKNKVQAQMAKSQASLTGHSSFVQSHYGLQ